MGATRSALFAILQLLLAACSQIHSPGEEPVEVKLVEAFPNLTFARPTDLQHPGDGTNRLFVLEQEGIVRAFPNDSTSGSSDTFLDIRDRVRSVGNEEGLLGLAFHPEYEENGYFYLD